MASSFYWERMSREFFYCSELSRRRGEPKYGTASVGEVWLLVEYPSWWSESAFFDSTLPAAVKAQLAAALRHIPRARLLFIKQDHPRRPQLKLFVVRACERAPFTIEFTLNAYDELLQLDLAAAANGRAQGGRSNTDALMLVCTHGRRDKCCAKFGYPLYKGLRASGEQAVWQSSHVGGDRFAANLVCFPHGLFYAHVTDADAPAIINAYRAHEIVLSKYRGRACYPQPVQAAEYFIRAEADIRSVDALRLLERKRINEHSWCVRFAALKTGRSYETTISQRISAFHQLLTCSATEEKSVEQFTLDDYRVTNERTGVQA
jgi:hypothetical protein